MVWYLAICLDDAKQDPVVHGVEIVVLMANSPRPASIHFLFHFFSFISLIADGPHITFLPVARKDLPISPRFTLYNFFIAMQVQHSYNSSTNGWILLTRVPTFSVTKERTQIILGKNRTHDFRTSRCAAYLLDHSAGT